MRDQNFEYSSCSLSKPLAANLLLNRQPSWEEKK
jgi:hypothetical protein